MRAAARSRARGGARGRAGCGGDEARPTDAAGRERATVAGRAGPSWVRAGRPEIGSDFRCGSDRGAEVPLRARRRAASRSGSRCVPATIAARPRRARSSRSRAGPGTRAPAAPTPTCKLFGPLLEHRELVLVDMRGHRAARGRSTAPTSSRGPRRSGSRSRSARRRLGRGLRGVRDRPRRGGHRRRSARRSGSSGSRSTATPTGPILAQAYAFRHPDSLDALVLDGAYPVAGENPWYPSLITTGDRGAWTSRAGARRTAQATPASGSSAPPSYMRRNRMNVGKLIDAIAGGAYNPPQSYVAVDRAIAKLLDGRPRAWRRLDVERDGAWPTATRTPRRASWSSAATTTR